MQDATTSSPLTRKLGGFSDLSSNDRDHLDALCRDARALNAGTTLIQEGDRPENVLLLIEGWAYRFKVLADGSRQIMAYLIPGDLCDVHIFILKEMDHSIALLSDAKVVWISKQDMLRLVDERPRIAKALWWATLVDEAILREWLANVGRRDAYERLAHLFCEMWLRMCQVGLTKGGKFSLPLTQEQLGDTMGMTAIHVNRMLKRMRGEGLVSVANKQITIHDIEGLRKIAGFNRNYLHLDRRD